MTKQEAFDEINTIQDYYVDKLYRLINSQDYSIAKTIYFTSPTGTGKTKMMSKLINRMPDCYFVITTLSKGQLHIQVRDSLYSDCKQHNYTVYGSADYKINSRLDAESIIRGIPENTKCIWLRDEGHIRTNRFDELLQSVCYKVVSFSATNTYSDIQCNFTQTMMLRTVKQNNGTPEDAIRKLLEVKEIHKNIKRYNPCAIFRCVGSTESVRKEVIHLCRNFNLKYIDISDKQFIMKELCEDDNEYDVIIHKYKLVEGIDIKRAHVLFMDNKPQNNVTTIQAIGRCRRNALLYRDDVDILSPQNKELLRKTRECYVYYDIENMKIDVDDNGELQYAFCDYVSCEALKANTTIQVENGQLPNGLYVIELEGKTGIYNIKADERTGFNIVDPLTEFYDTQNTYNESFLYSYNARNRSGHKISIRDVKKLKLHVPHGIDTNEPGAIEAEDRAFYVIDKKDYDIHIKTNVKVDTNKKIISFFDTYQKKFNDQYIESKMNNCNMDLLVLHEANYNITNIKDYIQAFINEEKNKKGAIVFCEMLSDIYNIKISCSGKEYLLGYICSDDEIVLLQYYCIKMKERGLPNYGIESFIERFINNRQKYRLYKYNRDDFSPAEDSESKKVSHILMKKDIHFIKDDSFLDKLYISCFSVRIVDPEPIRIEEKDIIRYFRMLDELIENYCQSDSIIISVESFVHMIRHEIKRAKEFLDQGMIPTVEYCYKIPDGIMQPLSDLDVFLLKNKYVKITNRITLEQLKRMKNYMPYTKVVNDRESAVIGVDLMRQIACGADFSWTEAKPVSAKIGNYNKFNSYISDRYKLELKQAESLYFSGTNDFGFDKKCNSMIGYCVEYYSKYLVYGKQYLEDFIPQAYDASIPLSKRNCIIVRACMLKYRDMMIKSFGDSVIRAIKGIKTKVLANDIYDSFVEKVVELGTRTAEYVKQTLYPEIEPEERIDPNLSIAHITGLADYITTDTILDVKVLNHIGEKNIRQVLAYHYLSTKRSDLHIKRVIVYDAVSNRSVVVKISQKNISHGYTEEDHVMNYT